MKTVEQTYALFLEMKDEYREARHREDVAANKAWAQIDILVRAGIYPKIDPDAPPSSSTKTMARTKRRCLHCGETFTSDKDGSRTCRKCKHTIREEQAREGRDSGLTRESRAAVLRSATDGPAA